MPSNYPPGVTGNEPQIVGDEDWEELNDWLADTGLEPEEIKKAVSKRQGRAEVEEKLRIVIHNMRAMRVGYHNGHAWEIALEKLLEASDE